MIHANHMELKISWKFRGSGIFIGSNIILINKYQFPANLVLVHEVSQNTVILYINVTTRSRNTSHNRQTTKIIRNHVSTHL